MNLVFTLSMPYGPGSTAVFLNGMLQERSLVDGWVETDPDTGVITLKEAPRSSGPCPDVLQVFYIDRSPPMLEVVCVKLRGIVRLGMKRGMHGVLSPSLPMHGHLQPQIAMQGHCDQRKDLRGSVESPKRMRGLVRECV